MKCYPPNANSVPTSPSSSTATWRYTLVVSKLAWPADCPYFGQRAFSGNDGEIFGGQGTLWDIDTGACRRLYREESQPWYNFSPDSTRLVEGNCFGGPLHAINLATSEKRSTVDIGSGDALIGEYEAIAFSPNGQVLATRTAERCITVWNATTGQNLSQCELPGLTASFRFSPDGTVLAMRCGFDRSNQRLLGYVVKSQEWLDWLCQPTTYTLLLDANTGRRIATLPYSDCLAFEPDGKTLITYSGDKNEILFWDVPPKNGIRPIGLWIAIIPAVLLSVWWWRARQTQTSKNMVGGSVRHGAMPGAPMPRRGPQGGADPLAPTGTLGESDGGSASLL